MPAGQLTLLDDASLNSEGIVPYERRTGVLLYQKSTFLDGSKMVLKGTGITRRQALAAFVIRSDFFAKTFREPHVGSFPRPRSYHAKWTTGRP